MNTQRPIEPRKVFIDLANAIAATLECEETPRELAAILAETVDPLTDLLVGSGAGYRVIAATLRGLVAINGEAETGYTVTRAEPEKSLVAHQGAIL